jgi:hypothetical protein
MSDELATKRTDKRVKQPQPRRRPSRDLAELVPKAEYDRVLDELRWLAAYTQTQLQRLHGYAELSIETPFDHTDAEYVQGICERLADAARGSVKLCTVFPDRYSDGWPIIAAVEGVGPDLSIALHKPPGAGPAGDRDRPPYDAPSPEPRTDTIGTDGD